MNRIIFSILALAITLLSTNAASKSLPPLPLPDGIPETIDGHESRTLLYIYQERVEDVYDTQKRNILGFINVKGANFITPIKPYKHGVEFEFSRKWSENEKTYGEVFYTCEREKQCEWLLKIATIPHIDARDWARENFDVNIVSTFLKTMNKRGPQHPYDLRGIPEASMNLKTPEEKISEGAKKQLYLGSECPEFMNLLGVNLYGQDRANHLLKVTSSETKPNSPYAKSGAKFEFGITTYEDFHENIRASNTIELSFNRHFGAKLRKKLVKAISNCPNRAQ